MCKCVPSILFLVCVAILSAGVVVFANPQAAAPAAPAVSAPPAAPVAKDPGPSPTLNARPPMMDANTVILFDGKDWSNFTDKEGKPSQWKVEDGIAIANGGDTISKESFGDFQAHIEFLCPVSDKEGQAKSNSGVYVHGRYEIQVLDSFGMPPADNLCGGIYRLATPLASAARPAGQWQTYDIIFRAPVLSTAARHGTPARITVLHNGIVIHNNVELPTTTAGGIDQMPVRAGPILLQDHGDPVQFRNIWVRRL